MKRFNNMRGLTVSVAFGLVAALILTGCSSFGALTGANTTSFEFPEISASAGFDTYGTQDPEWVPCADGFECAKVFAPADWSAPTDAQSEKVSLAVIRHPALGAEPALGTLFVNPGGPGASGVSYLQRAMANGFSDEVKQRYNMVSWDPRGVGASDAVSCYTSAEMDQELFHQPAETQTPADRAPLNEESAALDQAEIREMIEGENEYGLACLENTGALLEYVDTQSTAQDLDMLRSIVGDEKLNYLGFSYGTKIGTEYADMHPERVGRMVLDGALNPSITIAEHTLIQIAGFENALRNFVTDCLAGDSCALTGTTDEAMTQINTLLRKLDETPLVAPDGRNVGAQVAMTAIISALYSPKSWPNLSQALSELQTGNTRTTLALADAYYNRKNGEYQNNQFDAFQAITCLDASREPDPTLEEVQRTAGRMLELAPTIGEFQLYADLSCAGWPVADETDGEAEPPQANVLGRGAAPILVVGTTGDPATPYEWSVALAELLDSGELVTYHGEGHIAYGRHSCPTAIIDDYLLTGAVPPSDPHCARGE